MEGATPHPTVFVGYDGSESAQTAVRLALRRARPNGTASPPVASA